MGEANLDMRSRRLAWGVWAATLVIAILRPVLDVGAETSAEGVGDHLFVLGAVSSFATVGALIRSRQPGNRIGLLFTAVAAAAAVSMAAGSYIDVATERGLPFADLMAWISAAAFAAMFGPLAFLFLLFPTGTVPTSRWRWVLWVMLVAYAVNVVLFALTPGVIRSGFVDRHDGIVNPIALPIAWREPVQAITELAGIVVLAGALLSVVSLVLRFRRAGAEERQQIRWLSYLAAFLGVVIVVMLVLEFLDVLPQTESSVVGTIGFFVLIVGLFIGVPLTCAIAILRYRLYELDVVIKKAVVAFVLVAIVTAVAIAVAIAIPALVLGSEAGTANVVAVAVGVALGFALSPVRGIARRWADRVVYGRRASPYEVLTEFGGRAAQAYSTDDVLPRLAQVLAAGTGATSARVLLRVGDGLRESARWPTSAEPVDGDEHLEPVLHQGEELGALAVMMPASDPMDPAKERLVRDLASQAGLVLRNVRLIEELRASRQRLVAAQDEERRRIERNIHDGVQQQLVALAVKQRLAGTLVGKDDQRLRTMLEELQTETSVTLEDLRDLARGIFPPLLADQGLPAALEAQARRAAVPITLEVDGIGRFPPEVEATIYFCALEALNNVAKYSEADNVVVRLTDAAGEIRFEVNDNGRGFDPEATTFGTGIQGMADRLAALGGELTVRSAPGAGTTVSGRLAVEVRA